MDKKMIKIHYLLLLPLFMLTNMRSYSQDLFTKELQWVPRDSIGVFVFQDTGQIKEWGKEQSPFATVVYEKVLSVDNNDVFVVNIDICSGVYCSVIYIFKMNDDGLWQLMMGSKATRIPGRITVKTDDNEKEIIFETKSGVVGKLPYDILK